MKIITRQDNILRMSTDLMKKIGFTSEKMREADDTSQKLLRTQTTQ